jgi:hypothetical protein
MTETQLVSIEEVRALVVERQRYEDWLAALEARRDETPARVFERVHGDYVARRRDVLNRLREHVGELTSLGNDLDARLTALESRLGTLEDERAEAMLRTAVGEFDGDRWEQVRQDVEAQIAELGEQRTALQTESDEVRTLLASARSEPEAAPAPEPAIEAPAPLDTAAVVEDTIEVMTAPEEPVVSAEVEHGAPTPEPTVPIAEAVTAEHAVPASQTAEELAELDNALALFSHPQPADYVPPVISTPLMDGLDVFDDAELGDLRMSPPARATATVTPTANGNVADAANPAASRDGFDDLAFLRSVVDPSAQSGMVRATSGGDQQKTLRCTECSTMNLPTEWYCERCGGELAAF